MASIPGQRLMLVPAVVLLVCGMWYASDCASPGAAWLPGYGLVWKAVAVNASWIWRGSTGIQIQDKVGS